MTTRIASYRHLYIQKKCLSGKTPFCKSINCCLLKSCLDQREKLRRFLVARLGDASQARGLNEDMYLRFSHQPISSEGQNPTGNRFQMARSPAGHREPQRAARRVDASVQRHLVAIREKTLFQRLGCIAAFFALMSSAALGQADTIHVSIAAKPLVDALADLAGQGKLSIDYTGVDFKSTRTVPIEGWFRIDDALRHLLDGTGFEVVWVDTATIRIREAQHAVLEEIIVTATKRPKPARFAPYSIDVVGATEIRDAGTRQVSDLTSLIASLSAGDPGPAGGKLALRGLSDGIIAGHSQSVVGIYLDESRLTDDGPTPVLHLVDIDQTEVLKGPQGTLYGAGTLGGLVRIVTTKPVLDRLEGRVSLTTAMAQGGAPSTGGDVMFNLPIDEGVMAVRAVIYGSRDGGFVDDIGRGRRNVNGLDTYGGRLAAKWQLDDRWTIIAGTVGQFTKLSDSQYSDPSVGFHSRSNLIGEPQTDRFGLAHLTVDGSFDDITLTSTTAVTMREFGTQYDATWSWEDLTGFCCQAARFDDARNIVSVTQETRLVSADSARWSWMAGTFLSDRAERYRAVLAGADDAGNPYLARAETRRDHANETAVFGEVGVSLTDRFSLTAGARWFSANTRARATVTGGLVGAETFAAGDSGASGLIPKFVVSFQPTHDFLIYASAAKGFRLGGVNINAPVGAINVRRRRGTVQPEAFDSDYLWTYEAGVKAILFDERLNLNAAGYYTDWQNIQSDHVFSDGSLYTASVGNAHSFGLDADFVAQATEGLKLRGGVSWNRNTLSQANPSIVATQGRLPLVPNVALNFSARYRVLERSDWNAFASLQFAYFGKSQTHFDRDYSATMGNYALTNLRVEFEHSGWRGAIYVDNVMNRKANSLAYGNPFSFDYIDQVIARRPRTFGMEASFAY